MAFQVTVIELDSGKQVGRRPHGRFTTKTEAEFEAKRLAERFEHHNGFDPEQGYWWGRDPAPSRTYRYVVEGVQH